MEDVVTLSPAGQRNPTVQLQCSSKQDPLCGVVFCVVSAGQVVVLCCEGCRWSTYQLSLDETLLRLPEEMGVAFSADAPCVI